MIRNYSTCDKKIRAWDRKEKCMETIIDAIRKDGAVGFYMKPKFCNADFDPYFEWYENLIIMESIGAHDKTGKDIFELDFMTDGVTMGGIVIYDNEDCRYLIWCENMENMATSPWYDCFDEWEVIGNIFDSQHKDLFNKVREKLGL